MDSAAFAATLGEEELPPPPPSAAVDLSSDAAAAAGGVVPLGSEFPFRLNTSAVGVVSALLSPLSPPALFMLLMRSRTELFLAAATGGAMDDDMPLVVVLVVEVVVVIGVTVVVAVAVDWDFEESCSGVSLEFSASAVVFITDVTSPDFLSTPTMDHGRGFGRGFGLGTPAIAGCSVISDDGSDDKFDDGREVENFVALRPTIEPPLAVGEVAGTPPPTTPTDELSSAAQGPTSVVGDVSDPTRPVDLILGRQAILRHLHMTGTC